MILDAIWIALNYIIQLVTYPLILKIYFSLGFICNKTSPDCTNPVCSRANLFTVYIKFDWSRSKHIQGTGSIEELWC